MMVSFDVVVDAALCGLDGAELQETGPASWLSEAFLLREELTNRKCRAPLRRAPKNSVRGKKAESGH
jgi:hypothetical protein